MAVWLTGCSGNSASSVSPPGAPNVINTSSAVLEVQLVNAGNGAVYADPEGIGPGTVRSMPVNIGSGQYMFTCSEAGYGLRAGPVVTISGRASGGTAIFPLTADQLNSVTFQAHSYVAAGLARLVPQTAILAADIRAGNLPASRPGSRVAATWSSG